MAGKERLVATFTPSVRAIKLYRNGRIEYRGQSGSIIGATARLDESGERYRFRDTREVVLRIEGPDVDIAASLPVNGLQLQRRAREFAAEVNQMARELDGSAPAPTANAAPSAPPSPDPPLTPELLDQLERLGRLRDSRVLTEDEFQAQKAALLRPSREA